MISSLHNLNPSLIAALWLWIAGMAVAFVLWGIGEFREMRRQQAYRDALARGDMRAAHRLMGLDA